MKNLTSGTRAKAVNMMLASSVIISFSALIVRHMDAVPMKLNFYRALALMVSVWLLLLMQYRRTTIKLIFDIGGFGLLAGTMLAGAGITFLQSLTHTTAANTLFILSAIPFFTAALAWVLLSETLHRSTLISMLVAVLGLSIMVWDGFGAGSLYGNAMAIATALFFAVFAVIVRMKRSINMLPTLLVSTFIIMIVTSVSVKGELGISLKDFLLCVFWGAGLSGAANWLFISASRYLVAAELTLLMLLEFALGPVWVWLFLNEVPSQQTLVGGILVILAVAAKAMLEPKKSISDVKALK